MTKTISDTSNHDIKGFFGICKNKAIKKETQGIRVVRRNTRKFGRIKFR